MQTYTVYCMNVELFWTDSFSREKIWLEKNLSGRLCKLLYSYLEDLVTYRDDFVTVTLNPTYLEDSVTYLEDSVTYRDDFVTLTL